MKNLMFLFLGICILLSNNATADNYDSFQAIYPYSVFVLDPDSNGDGSGYIRIGIHNDKLSIVVSAVFNEAKLKTGKICDLKTNPVLPNIDLGGFGDGYTAKLISGALYIESNDNPMITEVGEVINVNLDLDDQWRQNRSGVSYDGNVGIGTSVPQAKLHISNDDYSYGAILAQANENSFQLYTKTNTTQPVNVEVFRLGLKHGNNEKNGFISFYRGENTEGGGLGFSTNGEEQLFINSAGNVGVGCKNTQGYKIAVKGSVAASEIKVLDVTYWADFVFDNSYNLRSLDEVETFINENNHLPDIPSEAKVKENGIDIAEMNKLLLQKIEELTLYMIEMKKGYDDVRKENMNMKSRLNKLENN